MEKLNLFIVADNALVANGLKHYLRARFTNVNISNFYDCRTCLKNITKQTTVVVLDHFIHGRSGIDTMRSIKTINPETDVVMHTSGEEVAAYLQTFYKDNFLLSEKKAN